MLPEQILNWGVELILNLQSAGEWLTAPMRAATFTGETLFFLLFLPLLYWSIDRRLGLRVGVALMISIFVSEVAKMALHGPRPYWYDSRVRLLISSQAQFGLPSGHAQNSTVIWSLLAAYVKRWWAWIIAAVTIFLVSLSRLYLGVHFPTDVLLGWIIGALIVWLVLVLEEPFLAWFNRLGATAQVLILFAASAIMALIAYGIAGLVRSSFQVPEAWIANADMAAPGESIGYLGGGSTMISAGALFGLALGALWIQRLGGFDARGTVLRRLARYLLGAAGAALLYFGLRLLFSGLAPEEGLMRDLLDYVCYAIVGFWIGGLGPLVFRRLTLADAAAG